jgi:hypothetical protein
MVKETIILLPNGTPPAGTGTDRVVPVVVELACPMLVGVVMVAGELPPLTIRAKARSSEALNGEYIVDQSELVRPI